MYNLLKVDICSNQHKTTNLEFPVCFLLANLDVCYVLVQDHINAHNNLQIHTFLGNSFLELFFGSILWTSSHPCSGRFPVLGVCVTLSKPQVFSESEPLTSTPKIVFDFSENIVNDYLYFLKQIKCFCMNFSPEETKIFFKNIFLNSIFW